DGKILIGGNNFSLYNGASANVIARLNQDGSLDDSFYVGDGIDILPDLGDPVVRDIYQLGDNKLLIGGTFTSYDGVPSYGVVQLMVNIHDPTIETKDADDITETSSVLY